MIWIINKNKLQLWDRRFCRNSSLQAVCDTPIAHITGGVLYTWYKIHSIQLWDRRFCRNSSLKAVWYSDRAHCCCVSIGRRLLLELQQCSLVQQGTTNTPHEQRRNSEESKESRMNLPEKISIYLSCVSFFSFWQRRQHAAEYPVLFIGTGTTTASVTQPAKGKYVVRTRCGQQ